MGNSISDANQLGATRNMLSLPVPEKGQLIKRNIATLRTDSKVLQNENYNSNSN